MSIGCHPAVWKHGQSHYRHRRSEAMKTRDAKIVTARGMNEPNEKLCD
jgi:hypothetical protein